MGKPVRAVSPAGLLLVGRGTRPVLGDPVGQVGLPGAGDAHRAGRHVLGDDRTGGGVSPVADFDRRHEHVVGARAGVVTDDGVVLVLAVVVHEHGGGADVGLLADRRIADIGQVRDLRAAADFALLELDVGADMHLVMQNGAGAKVGERADRDVGPDRRAVGDGAVHLTARPDSGVGERGVGPDYGTRCDLGVAVELHAGQDRRIWFEPHAGIDPGGGRVDDRDAGSHVPVQQPVVVDAVRGGELRAVVDAGGLGVVDR